MKKIYNNTPIGRVEAPEWEVNKLAYLTDEDLIQRAIEENKHICVSPTTYRMIELRQLERELQHRINPHAGPRHDLPKWANVKRLIE